MELPSAGGELVTKPLKFTGGRLETNFATSKSGSIRVELQGTDGKPLANFALADCVELRGDAIAQTVKWKKGADVSGAGGKAVRLRFVLKDADLFSFRFHAAK